MIQIIGKGDIVFQKPVRLCGKQGQVILLSAAVHLPVIQQPQRGAQQEVRAL